MRDNTSRPEPTRTKAPFRPKPAAGPIDVLIGQRVQQRRMALNLSQKTLAKAIGVTFQQVRKYETGRNRISVSRLLDIAQALFTDFGYFVEDAQTRNPATPDQQLSRLFARIRKPKYRDQLLDLAKTLAEAS
jgi:transcriptional regulator with XRE-family HTH domain